MEECAAHARQGGKDEAKGMKMDSGGALWAVMNIIGPLLLVVVLAWALMRNRKSKRADLDRTERATRDLYREEEATRRRSEDNAP